MIRPRLRQGTCRLCLWESNSLWDIFGELAERRNFVLKIQACVNIIVSKDDGFSSLICPKCIYKIELFYDFQSSCKRSDEIQKRYNGFQDVGRADVTEDQVLPATAVHCTVSNCHVEAQGLVETIDIKEEPIDGEEVVATDGGDERFEDADLDLEVEPVAENEVEEDVVNMERVATGQKKLNNRERGNGSCLQLTPPRSPSQVSEETCSASEFEPESEPSSCQDQNTEGKSSEQQTVDGEAVQTLSGGRTTSNSGGHVQPPAQGAKRCCRHCGKSHPVTSSCWQHEWRSLPSTLTTIHDSDKDGPGDTRRAPSPPPRRYHNQCRFCCKWYTKTGVCRVHEMDCGPLHGYAPPPLPQGRGPKIRCRFCYTHLPSKMGRCNHENYCFHRLRKLHRTNLLANVSNNSEKALSDAATGSDVRGPTEDTSRNCRHCGMWQANCTDHEVNCQARPGSTDDERKNCKDQAHPPPPSKYPQQCRFCSKYFRRVIERCAHEVACGPLHGYPTLPLPAVNSAVRGSERKCSLCGRLCKSKVGRLGHEYHCRRRSLKASRVARVGEYLQKGMTPFPLPTRHNLSINQCRYCQGRFLSTSQRISHEYSCSKAVEWVSGSDKNAEMLSGGQDAATSLKCRYCGKGYLKWRSLLTHEYHCRRKGPRVVGDGDVKVEVAIGSDNDETVVSELGALKEEKQQQPPNRCSYCGKWLRNRKACKLHEYYCSRFSRVSSLSQATYNCSYCSRCFLRRNSCVLHERFCLKVRRQVVSSSGPVTEVALNTEEAQHHISSTTSETVAPELVPADEQGIKPQETPALERRRKDISLCEPVTALTDETEDWMCRYCDKHFRYRECLRTHEVKCNALATYQYSTPQHRTPRFFTCPLCRKAFKFRRKLHNHWKVCRARTSVAADTADLNDVENVAHGDRNGSEVVSGIVQDASQSPEEGWRQWHGWPSCHSVESLTDEESSTADSSGLNCKLCHKDFCSRILLELHTLNECVYQRIRNDHAYAQCESSGVDESTLMRMARVELQRLLLCSCCGRIFEDRKALADHELAERDGSQGQTPGETGQNPEAWAPEDTISQQEKKAKLEHAADENCGQLDNKEQQEFSHSAEKLAESDQRQCLVLSVENKQLEGTEGNLDSYKNSIRRECLQETKCCQCKLNGATEQHIRQLHLEGSEHKQEIKKEEIILQPADHRQQLKSEDEQGLNKSCELQKLLRGSTNFYKGQFQDSPAKQWSTDTRSEQENRAEGSILQQLLNEPIDLSLQLQEQHSENPKEKQQDRKCNMQHHMGEAVQKKQCLKSTGRHHTEDRKQCQVGKDGNPTHCFTNGMEHPTEYSSLVPPVPCILP